MEAEPVDLVKADNGLAALAEAGTELPVWFDNRIEPVALTFGIGPVEIGFGQVGSVDLEPTDLGSDSAVKVATELVQLMGVVAETAQAHVAAGPAAELTTEAPEVGADVRQQGDPGAGLVDLAGLRCPMEAQMARIGLELLPSIDLETARPQGLSLELEPAEVVKKVIAIAEGVMAGMTFQKSVGPGIVLAESVDPPAMVARG